MFDFITGNIGLISGVVTGAGVLIGYKFIARDVNQFFEASVDLALEIEKANEDGKFTEDDIKRITKKASKVAAVGVVLWIRIKRFLAKKSK